MAIDTATKRRAVASVAVPGAEIAVTPDATPGAFWRYSVGNSYLPQVPIPPGGGGEESGVTFLGGMVYRTDDNTPLGG
jgi:hypothetical protein